MAWSSAPWQSSAATPEKVPTTNALLAETTAGVARYQDPSVAIADGYRPVTPTSSLISEWINPRYAKAGKLLDPRHPQRLMYVSGPGGPLLVGVVFVLPSAAVSAPTIGGTVTPWQRHTDYPLGGRMQPTPAMLHVWVVYNPAGPFAEDLSPRAIVRMLDGA